MQVDTSVFKSFWGTSGPNHSVYNGPIAFTTWVVLVSAFHIMSAMFELADRRKWLLGFRRHPAGDELTYFQMLPRVVFNQVFLLLPSMLVFERYGLAFKAPQWWTMSFPMLVVGILWIGVGHDIVFYLGHRFLLHSSWGFKRLGHNLHHSVRANAALSSMYMASLDFVIEIVLPYLIPLMVLDRRACVGFNFLIAAMGSFGGLYEHSGYNVLPKLENFSTTAHFMHHRLGFVSFSDGFGSPSIMDNVFMTSYLQYLRAFGGAKSM